MKKLEFIISIKVGFGEVLTGGVLVLHRLAYVLAEKGFKVTIFTNPEYPHENIVVRKDCSENNLNFDYDPTNTVIIPSFDWKNNSNLIHVSRWALYHISESLMENVDETDEIFNFGSFNIPGVIETGKLTVFDYQKEIFKNNNKKRTGKFCHILLKNNPPYAFDFIENFDSFDLSDYKMKGCFEYLAEKFNSYEYFLTFDDKTFLTTAAAMCGCKSIILCKDDIRPEEYRRKNPIQTCGVAYGLKDLNWAEKTIDFVHDNIDSLIQSDNKTVDKFINFWQNKIQMI